MTRTHPIDGSLSEWEKVAEEALWGGLLLGNGLSINVWADFDYTSLYEQARRGRAHGMLHAEDLALFEEFETENFEIILGNLNAAIRTSTALGDVPSRLIERYQSIQAALGHAVRAVHITRSDISDLTLETIKDVMEEYDVIFTTSYDLVVYWAMGFGDEYGRLVDLLWYKGPNGSCEFHPEHINVWTDYIPVYYLHGAMHLIVDGEDRTRKLLRTPDQTVLDQFGEPIPGDPQARALLISEGSSHDKLRAIEDNIYLSHALDQLYECDLPLIVFGSALGEQDRHLIDAINEHPDRPVAVSMQPGDKSEMRSAQGEIRGRLDAHELHFFDATTHPLGDADLRCRPFRVTLPSRPLA